MELEERRALGAAVAAIDRDLGAVVADPQSSIEQLSVPLRDTRVFVAEKFLPTRPLRVYFAHHQAGPTFLLNERPAEFNRMMDAEGQPVNGLTAALDLARLYLETTRRQDERFLIVTSADELPWMPGGDPARIEAARREVDEQLAPPAVRPLAEGGFEVIFRVIHDRSLEEVTVRMSTGGRAQASARMLVERLPLAYVAG